MVDAGCPIRTPFRTCLELCAIENCKKPDCRRPSSGEIDQPQLQAVDYRPGPVGYPQLRDDVLDVVLGRTEADYEVPNDLTVGASQLHQPQDLQLTRGQGLHRVRGRMRTARSPARLPLAGQSAQEPGGQL